MTVESAGFSVGKYIEISAAVKVVYTVTKKLQAGFEYYGSTGPYFGYDPLYQQQQQVVPATEYDFGPDWEFNLGVGFTGSTDSIFRSAEGLMAAVSSIAATACGVIRVPSQFFYEQ